MESDWPTKQERHPVVEQTPYRYKELGMACKCGETFDSDRDIWIHFSATRGTGFHYRMYADGTDPVND